ncbi:MAG: 50S ribosomal protein L24 [Verrucomicrobiae bacterium]|nr:50S ribosomal protein L24 [Verrucomicrobiae bacterium]MDW8344561.1 50S ribosomal protein L24 [Verrucomicrobiae bacterium]
MMAGLHVKKGQQVVVISGDEKGKTGTVLRVLPDKRKVVVEGVNIIKKAVRKSRDNPKGGIISREAPIWASKVMLRERWDARRKKRGVATAES